MAHRADERISVFVPVGARTVVELASALDVPVQPCLSHAGVLPKIKPFTDNPDRKHEYGVQRVRCARRPARLFEGVGFRTEFIRHEGQFSDAGEAPQTLMMLERRMKFPLRFAFLHYTHVGRRVT